MFFPKAQRINHFRQAFSLTEMVIVLALLAVLAVAVIPSLNIQQGSAQDAQAKTSIDALLDAQTRLKASDGTFANMYSRNQADGVNAKYQGSTSEAARVRKSNPEITFVFSDDTSTTPKTVSSLMTGEAVVAAVAGGGNTCWIARRDYAAVGQVPTEIYGYYNYGGSNPRSSCTANTALSIFNASQLQAAYNRSISGDPSGASWKKPRQYS